MEDDPAPRNRKRPPAGHKLTRSLGQLVLSGEKPRRRLARNGDGDVVLIAAGTFQPDATIDTLGKAIKVQGAVDASGLPTTIVECAG